MFSSTLSAVHTFKNTHFCWIFYNEPLPNYNSSYCTTVQLWESAEYSSSPPPCPLLPALLFYLLQLLPLILNTSHPSLSLIDFTTCHFTSLLLTLPPPLLPPYFCSLYFPKHHPTLSPAPISLSLSLSVYSLNPSLSAADLALGIVSLI